MIENTSGFIPHDFKVLVLLDEINEKTSGGIILLIKDQEREKYAQRYGSLIAVGKNAFLEWRGDQPNVGDRICIGEYTGRAVKGKDGKEYRICNDQDVWASINF